MINLNFHLSHPFSNRWGNIYNTGGRITQHKSWEFQIMKTNTIFEVSLRFTTSGDHAGLNVGCGLLGFSVVMTIHDNRHWDYKKGCFTDNL